MGFYIVSIALLNMVFGFALAVYFARDSGRAAAMDGQETGDSPET